MTIELSGGIGDGAVFETDGRASLYFEVASLPNLIDTETGNHGYYTRRPVLRHTYRRTTRVTDAGATIYEYDSSITR